MYGGGEEGVGSGLGVVLFCERGEEDGVGRGDGDFD